jgi:23S rRNA pseudouridine2605 synthase
LTIRINKYLADAGIASRRAADELIVRGVVMINGRRARPGDPIDPSTDEVRVDGRVVRKKEEPHVTVALNKPLGVVTTMRDERGRRSIAELLPKGRRLFPIGRLDAQTTGLLLCTSDGELCRRLSHPSFEIPRRYQTTVEGAPTAEALQALGARKAGSTRNGARFEMTLTGGKNREIRRACAQHGLRVVELQRVAFGPIELGRLVSGQHRVLDAREVRALARLTDLNRS